MTDTTIKDGADWEARYVAGSDRWTLASEPPCLRDLLLGLGSEPQRSVLVPGAGTGIDALAWARAGHRVTAVDIAPTAVAALRARAQQAGVTLDAREADIFDLPDELRGSFDVVWEQTCYCAIQPDQRVAYVRSMAAVLKPDGILYGLFWNHGVPEGPPWSISELEVEERFAEHFDILEVAAVPESAPPRSNEFLARLRVRS